MAGLRPNKRHGQCFLTDAQAVDAVVRDAGVGPGDRVIEVGTGPGLLTHALCEAGAGVETFDVDGGMLAFAQAQRGLAGDRAASITVMCWRASATWRRSLSMRSRETRPAHAVWSATFPTASPRLCCSVCWRWTRLRSSVSWCRTKSPRRCSLRWGGRRTAHPRSWSVFRPPDASCAAFPPTVFWPQPRVRSALLSLAPRFPRPLPAAEAPAFGAFVTALFTRRRKVLPAALAQAVPSWTPPRRRAPR